MLFYFYLCTVQVVTFTSLTDQLMHLFQHFYIHIKTPETLLKKCSIKASYVNKNPTCFSPYSRTIFRGRTSLLTPTTLQLHASSYVCIGMWSYALCLYLYPVYLPVWSGRFTTRQHTGRYNGYTYRGHTTTYQYKHMTKRADEAW
jgi:hypothetical protein